MRAVIRLRADSKKQRAQIDSSLTAIGRYYYEHFYDLAEGELKTQCSLINAALTQIEDNERSIGALKRNERPGDRTEEIDASAIRAAMSSHDGAVPSSEAASECADIDFSGDSLFFTGPAQSESARSIIESIEQTESVGQPVEPTEEAGLFDAVPTPDSTGTADAVVEMPFMADAPSEAEAVAVKPVRRRRTPQKAVMPEDAQPQLSAGPLEPEFFVGANTESK